MHSDKAVGIFEEFLVLTQGVTSGYANEQTGIVEFLIEFPPESVATTYL
jgi:hypothetical protein